MNGFNHNWSDRINKNNWVIVLLLVICMISFFGFMLVDILPKQTTPVSTIKVDTTELITFETYGDIVYLKGNHVYTDSGLYDTTFNTRVNAVYYFEEFSHNYMYELYGLLNSYDVEIYDLTKINADLIRENRKLIKR